MPILGLHPTSDYAQERYDFLNEVESNELRVYVVKGEYIATIGIGINLNANSANLNAVLMQLGFDINGTQLTGDAWIAEQYYIGEIQNAVKITYFTNGAVQAALDGILQNRAVDSRYSSYPSFTRRSVFEFANDTESKNAFDAIIGTYESRVDSRLGFHLADSKERIALVSLSYNTKTGATDLLGPKLIAAINNDNRAEAWYEIRYNSNLNGIHANRRYQEADMFGLYDTDPSNVTEAEAKEIMRMYTIHELQETNPARRMSAYEDRFAHKPAKSIAQEIEPARNHLVNNFAMGKPIDGEVIVGAGLESYDYKEKGLVTDVLVGTFGNDLIFGEKGNDIILGSLGDDVIYGGEGDDHITGGLGNDLLYGGADNDTYYVNAGDGVDTIEDKEGINKVILCGKEINFFYDTGDGKYKSPDGTLDGVMSGGDFIVTCNDGTTTTTVILNEDFQWGDFGIELKDMPDNPVTTNTISGDLLPKDFNPEEPGIQTEKDEWNNVICTGESDPGSADALYDTTGNDLIDGKAGNDFIVSERGGNDWVKGGEGNDYIIANYNMNDIVIECGPGEDIVFGGRGNDKIYCDAYGETDELIASGETAENIDARGNAVSGGAYDVIGVKQTLDGDDYVFGSNASDVLFGGGGKDFSPRLATGLYEREFRRAV